MLQRVLVILLGLGAVAFITLLERKLLGLRQVRLGPNKVSFLGLLQPVIDGVKLLLKEALLVIRRQALVFFYSPFVLLFLFLLLWILILSWTGSYFVVKYAALMYFRLLGLGAYAVIITGWSRVSSFSKLGSIRGILQRLSFEVALILLLIVVLTNIKGFLLKSEERLILEAHIIWLALWVFLSLIETNRAPFDLLEGERELIRGFNVEIGRVFFVYLFLREYGIIIVISAISRAVIEGEVRSILLTLLRVMLFMRRCFPRVRYDVIIMLIWQRILPLTVLRFLLYFFMV